MMEVKKICELAVDVAFVRFTQHLELETFLSSSLVENTV